jgi:hypothetical protein
MLLLVNVLESFWGFLFEAFGLRVTNYVEYSSLSFGQSPAAIRWTILRGFYIVILEKNTPRSIIHWLAFSLMGLDLPDRPTKGLQTYRAIVPLIPAIWISS